MTFFVHKVTSGLTRTLKIGTGNVSCTRIQKSHLKPLKITIFELLYMFAGIWVQDNQASKMYVALLENENFLFLCASHGLNFVSSKN